MAHSVFPVGPSFAAPKETFDYKLGSRQNFGQRAHVARVVVDIRADPESRATKRGDHARFIESGLERVELDVRPHADADEMSSAEGSLLDFEIALLSDTQELPDQSLLGLSDSLCPPP